MSKGPTDGGAKSSRPKSIYLNRKGKKPIKRPEQAVQIALFNYLRPLMVVQKYQKFIAFHVPNGGKRTRAEASIFQSMGVMPGVADIILLFPEHYTRQLVDDGPGGCVSVRRPPSVCFVEVKAGSGAQEESQAAFEERVAALGFDYRLLKVKAGDFGGAIAQMEKILRDYGVPV